MTWMCVIVLLPLTTHVFSQEYDYPAQGLTTMPDIPTDAVSIRLATNNIATFSHDAFADFYQLRFLGIGGNPITELPNMLPVADTLVNLNFVNTQVSQLDDDMFNALTALEKTRMELSLVTSIPNVPGPGKTLKSIIAFQCLLEKFPAVSHYKALEELVIGGNPMTSVQDSDVDNLEKLRVLTMNNVPLLTLPDNPKALQTLETIDISSSGVSTMKIRL